MMINCPKCRFSQPKDQYCANCGVDMIAFKPAPKPLVTRILTNTTLQVVTLGAVVAGIALYVKEQNRVEFARRVSETPIARNAEAMEEEMAAANAEAANQRARGTQALASNTQTTSQTTSQVPTTAVAEDPAEDSVGAQSLNLASTTEAATPLPAPTAPPAVVTATPSPPNAGINAALAPASNVRVWFMEGSRAAISQILTDAKQASSDGTVGYGVVANIDAKLRAARGWQAVEQTGARPIRLNQPNIIFKGSRDEVSGQNIGLTVQVVPLTSDEAGTHLQVDAIRALRDQASGIESFNFNLPESFTVPKGGAVILTGALPHRNLTEAEDRFYRASSNLLRVMTSERFRSGATDVAIIIEAK